MKVKSTEYRQILFDSLLLLAASLLLLAFAFYNGYPLVYSDTGSYIHYGFEKEVPFDRPVMYGLFLRYSSLKFSLWLPVFFQGLMTAWSIRYLVGAFGCNIPTQRKLFSLIILVLVAFTGLSQKCSNVLPDFTTALISVLAAGWALRKQKSTSESIIAAGIALFAMLSHGSNLYIFLICTALISLLYILRMPAVRNAGRKLLIELWMFCGVGIISLLMVNFIFSGEFFLSRNGSIFVTGHLADCGLLDEFLIDKCAEKNYPLCEWKGACANVDFLWDETSSPHFKTGGWHKNPDRYNEMLHDFFTSRKYIWKYIVSTTKLGAIQIFDSGLHTEMENLPMVKGSAPYGQVEWRFPRELHSYSAARQQQGTLDYTVINTLQTVLLILSLIVIPAGIIYLRKRSAEFNVLLLTLTLFTLFIVINGFVCAGLTIPNSRFGARVIWLIPLVAILFASEIIRHRSLQKRGDSSGENQIS